MAPASGAGWGALAGGRAWHFPGTEVRKIHWTGPGSVQDPEWESGFCCLWAPPRNDPQDCGASRSPRAQTRKRRDPEQSQGAHFQSPEAISITPKQPLGVSSFQKVFIPPNFHCAPKETDAPARHTSLPNSVWGSPRDRLGSESHRDEMVTVLSMSRAPPLKGSKPASPHSASGGWRVDR